MRLRRGYALRHRTKGNAFFYGCDTYEGFTLALPQGNNSLDTFIYSQFNIISYLLSALTASIPLTFIKNLTVSECGNGRKRLFFAIFLDDFFHFVEVFEHIPRKSQMTSRPHEVLVGIMNFEIFIPV